MNIRSEIPRLQAKYHTEIISAMRAVCGRNNLLSLPRICKITVSMGVGAARDDKKVLDTAVEALGIITGQKPLVTVARKAIANFRLRQGVPIGCKVTLRRQRMFEFLDRLISVALPRVRDFRGLSRTAFDGMGNYSFGIVEQLVFPELNPDKFVRLQGLNVAIGVRNANDAEALELLRAFGMPFRAIGD